MCMPNKNVISEAVVSLTADVDNAGMQKLFNLMDTNRLKAYTLAASLVAVTTGVYKFMQSIAKEEFELEKLSKTKKKSIEETRAENEALKAMGMTLEEIKKDKALQTMYNDLVKFNKEMQMPSMKSALENINKLRGEFYKLKSALSYAVEAIGAQVFANIEAPMERIGGKLKSAAEWIRDNLTSIATKVGAYITGFTKGVLAIGKTVENIVNWVKELPEGIKGVALALGAVFLLLKTGPLGQILAIVTAIGDVIHDYDAYKWNKQNRENPEFWATTDGGWTDNQNDANIARDEQGNPIVYQAKTGGDAYWEILDSNLSDEQKAGSIARILLDNMSSAMGSAFNDFDMSNVFGDGSDNNGGLIGAIKRWFDNEENKTALRNFGESFVTFVCNAVREVGGTAGGAAGKVIDAIFGTGTIDSSVYEGDGSAASTLAGGLGGFFSGFFTELGKEGSTPWNAFKKGIGSASIWSAIPALISNIQKDENGGFVIDWSGMGVDLVAVGKSFYGIIKAGIDAATTAGTSLLDIVGGALRDSNLTNLDGIDTFISDIGDIFQMWSKDETLVGGIASAVGVLFSGGSILEAIFGGIFGSFTQAREDAMREAVKNAHPEMPEDILDSLSGNGLQSMYDNLGESQKKNLWGDTFGNLGAAAGDLISGIWDALLSATTGMNTLGSELLSKLLGALFNLLGLGVETTDLEGNTILGGMATALGVKIAGGGFFTSLFSGLVSTIISAQDQVEGDQTLWDVLAKDADEIWQKVLDIWEGPIEDGVRNKNKGLVSVFEKLFGGGEGAESLVEKVKRWLEPIGDAISDWFNGLIDRIYANTGAFGKFIMKQMGYQPKTDLVVGENGQTTGIKDANGNEVKLNEGVEYTSDAMKFFNEFASHFYADGNGHFTQKTTDGFNGRALTGWRNTDYSEMLNYVVKTGKLPEGFTYQGLLDNYVQNYDENYKPKASEPVVVEPELDKGALAQQLAQMPPGQWPVEPVLGSIVGKDGKKAWGGRIGSEGTYTVGEDGAEYIIPITKTDRAVSLIRQMFSEMGASAVSRVMDGFGIGGEGTIGSSPASMVSALQGMTMANTYNISAPVSINVNSNGANAKEIGTSIYDAAERHLIKTLRGVCV